MLTVEQIKILMSDRNVSEVARRVGVTRVALHNILHDKSKPSYQLLEKLSNYFGKECE